MADVMEALAGDPAFTKGTQREDGTWRKDVKVRKGFAPEPVDGTSGEKKGKGKAGKGGRAISFVSEGSGKGAGGDKEDAEDEEDEESEDGDFAAGASGSDDEESSEESEESSEEEEGGADNGDPFRQANDEVGGEDFVAYSSTLSSNANNEDRFFVDTKQRLFGVFDGHGGRECAAFSAREVAAEFAARYTPPAGTQAKMDGLEEMFFSAGGAGAGGAGGQAGEKGEDKGRKERTAENKKAMKETFQAVDRRFLEGQGTSNPTCGSCALLCLLEGGSLYSAIVGDSRAILVRRGEKGVVTGIPLTIDQNTSHDGECAKVVARSGDPEAIRYNESEVMRGMRREAIKRVGGTLMVTRALGDGYLKDKAYSMWPFNRSLPYITGKPKVSRVEIDIAKDAFVVVASDGIWEHMTNDQVAVEVMRHADCEAEKASSAAVPAKGAKGDKAKGKEKEGKGTKDNIATGLVDEVVRIAARKQCMPVAELRSMRPGGARRGYLDDLTVVIVPLPLIAASKKRAAGGAGGGVEEERSVKRKTG